MNLACAHGGLQERLAAAHSVDALIAIAAEEGLSFTAAELRVSCGTALTVDWSFDDPGLGWLQHVVELSRAVSAEDPLAP